MRHATARFIALALLAGLCLVWLPARAGDCTPAQKVLADAQLWLNQRDKSAALKQHLPWGVPTTQPVRLLIQRDYVIGYSDTLLVPQWTAHRLDFTRLGKATRIDCFRRDPRIPAPAASLLSDYNDPVYDQGHLTPNGDMSTGKVPVLNSFVLSNMAPQQCELNRGVWQIFESLVRIWAEDYGTLFVITGSVFDHDEDGLRDDDASIPRMRSRNGKARVAVPSHFYKILVRRIDDLRAESLAVMMRNEQTALDGEEAISHVSENVVPLARIELLTGQRFFTQRGDVVMEETMVLWPINKPAAGSLAYGCKR